MATFEEAKDEMKTCPYNTCHVMKASRYQQHVAKCEKEHPNSHLTTCPFNACHRQARGEMEYHVLRCDCRTVVDRQLIASNNNSTHRGHVGVPSYHSEAVETNENWDEEIATGSCYSPNVEPPPGGIRTEFAGMKPAARKKYYNSLHQRNGEELAETIPKDTKNTIPGLSEPEKRPTKSADEMRTPRTLSFAQMLAHRKPEPEYPNIGLGRGQKQPKSKIAANFSRPNPEIRKPISAPQMPGFPNPNLGMGRGTSAVNSGNFQHVGEVLSRGGF